MVAVNLEDQLAADVNRLREQVVESSVHAFPMIHPVAVGDLGIINQVTVFMIGRIWTLNGHTHIFVWRM